VALVFGLFEAGMPVVGVLAGHAASSALGGAARLTGGILLTAVGCYQLYAAMRERAQCGESGVTASADGWAGWRLLVSGFGAAFGRLGTVVGGGVLAVVGLAIAVGWL
jgi:putative Mn2+ efflux pump MntP